MLINYPWFRRKESDMAKRVVSLLVLFALLLPVATWAQQAAPPPGAIVSDHAGPGFLTMEVCGGPVGLPIWFGIFLWIIALLPLGLLSIVHCARLRVDQLPLATKLLICGIVWLFVLGLFGIAHGCIFAFATLSSTTAGAAQQAMLALNIAESLYYLFAALIAIQVYLLFLAVSLIIFHSKRRKLLANPASKTPDGNHVERKQI